MQFCLVARDTLFFSIGGACISQWQYQRGKEQFQNLRPSIEDASSVTLLLNRGAKVSDAEDSKTSSEKVSRVRFLLRRFPGNLCDVTFLKQTHFTLAHHVAPNLLNLTISVRQLDF